MSATQSCDGTTPENILTGQIFDMKGEYKNRWRAEIKTKPSITLEWEKPVKISEVAINLDTGSRLLTQTVETALTKRVLQAPQPETLKDFNVKATLADGSEKELANIRDNYQKRCIIKIPEVDAKKLTVECVATNGSPISSIFEIRVY